LYQCFLSPSADSFVRPGARKANSIIRQSRKGVRASMDTAMPMRSGLIRLLPGQQQLHVEVQAWLMRSKCAASSNQGAPRPSKLSRPRRRAAVAGR
jgi:hypothetical protein